MKKKNTSKKQEKIDLKSILKKENIKKIIPWVKENSKKYMTTNVLFLTFLGSSLINEWLLRCLTVKNVFAIKPLLADISLILIIGSFGYFFKPKNQFKYFFSWAIFFTILCLINSMYYTNYVSFASFSLLETSLQIVDVGDAVVENVMELKDFCYFWQLLALIFVNKYLKKNNYYVEITKTENGKVSAIRTIIAGLFFMIIFISTLSSVDISRLNKQWNRESIVMEFGAYTYQFNDLFSTIKSELNPLFGYDKHAKEFREFYA